MCCIKHCHGHLCHLLCNILYPRRLYSLSEFWINYCSTLFLIVYSIYLIHVRFSDDISVCLQILNLEFANAIYALVCLLVKLQHPAGTHQNPLNVLDASNMYLSLFLSFKIVLSIILISSFDIVI